jgi:serine phosphatase RsbU (regulator of sigma subunit)
MSVSEIEREIAEQRRPGLPHSRDMSRKPATDESLVHEKLLAELERRDMTQEQIEARFADIGPAIQTIIDREEKSKLIERYRNKEDRRVYLRITEEGKKFLMFSQGLESLRRQR